MILISLKDYAKQNNITYEAVRQQVNRYADELGDHIIRDGRQQFLDEEAVVFLDSKRQKNPVTMVQQSKDEAIEQLRQEKEKLLIKIAAQADKISELSEWKSDNAVAIAEANQRQELLEAGEKKIAALEGKIAEVEQKASEDVQKALKELSEAHDQFEKELDLVKKEHDKKMQAEKQRRISFKEYWQRRKSKE